MVSMSSSGGACSTMMTAPMRQIAHPSLPNMPSSSLRKYEPNTAPINTDSAPRGVTRMAGAKAYAAKLHTSPTTTAYHLLVCRASQSRVWSWSLTCANAGPPQGIPEVYEALSLEAMCFACLVETLPRYCQPAGSYVRWSQGGTRALISRVCGLGATFFVMTKLVPAQARYVSQVHT